MERLTSASGLMLSIAAARGEPAFLWVIQSRWPEGWRTEIIPASTREVAVGSTFGLVGAPSVVWVSAVDRTGNQSTLVRVAGSSAS